MKTRITEMLGIEHPIVQGGMHFVGLAVMAMGAEGMNMGTRFIATQEAPVHENVEAGDW